MISERHFAWRPSIFPTVQTNLPFHLHCLNLVNYIKQYLFINFQLLNKKAHVTICRYCCISGLFCYCCFIWFMDLLPEEKRIRNQHRFFPGKRIPHLVGHWCVTDSFQYFCRAVHWHVGQWFQIRISHIGL